MRRPIALVIATTLGVAACGDGPAEPAEDIAPLANASQGGGVNVCAPAPDFTVTDEASLLAALGSASPRDVIALDGLIDVAGPVDVGTSDLTITCATAGSGLRATPGFTGALEMLRVFEARVTVDHLTLDGSNATRGAFRATSFASDLAFSNNTVTCGPVLCAFLTGTVRATITDNHFEASGVDTGLHLQRAGVIGVDGSRIEGNTFVETTPSANPGNGACCWGAIRVHTGTGVLISDNHVSGAWGNGLSLTNLHQSTIRNNRIFDPINFGIITGIGSGGVLPVDDNTFRNNRVNGAGLNPAASPFFGFAGGIWLRFPRVCGNVFFGNNLNGNADDLGVLFDVEAGDNTLAGSKITVVDNGDFDCDGDAVADPNIITGVNNVLADPSIGGVISEAASESIK